MATEVDEADPMRATRAIADFLRHLRERDLPDPELFELKAQAFELMAEAEHVDPPFAAECRAIADEARRVARGTVVQVRVAKNGEAGG